MVEESKEILKERVNLRFALYASFLCFLGLLLMLISSSHFMAPFQTAKIFFSNLGSLIFVTGLITVVWELLGKRAFVDELFSLFSISRAAAEAGIIDYCSSFQDQKIDWNSLFRNASQIDLLFMGSSTWRNSHFEKMEAFLKQKRAQLTIILPDLNDFHVIQNIANQMNKNPEDIKRYINEAITHFIDLSKKFPSANISIWILRQPPWFSVFRFSNKAVVSLYSHQHKRVGVPTFICSKGGKLFDFIDKEISSIIDCNGKNSIGEKIFPEK